MKQQLRQQHVPPTDVDTLNRHDAAQGVTTNPQDAGSGGGAPIGGHNQDSRTWTQGGPSQGNPAKLTDRDKRTTHGEREPRTPSTDRETRSKQADAGVAEEQAGAQPATDAKDSPTLPVGKKHEKRNTM